MAGSSVLFSSFGGLPKGMTTRQLGTLSIRRNEILSDLFFRMGKVERVGMGIRKMKQAMAAAGLREPVFEADTFFRAIFHRSPEFALKGGGPGSEAVSEKLSEKMSEKASEKTPRRILAALAQNPKVTIADLAEIVGVSDRTIERHLKRLQAQGRLRRVGPAKGGHWEVLAPKSPDR